MLQYLYVKNLALINEIEDEFGRGLNIFNRKTVLGKSIIIGSDKSCSWLRIHERHSSPGSEIRYGGADIFQWKMNARSVN